jgi:hypothetical protein
MGGAVCHYRVVQWVEIRVYHHKGKYFVLNPNIRGSLERGCWF